jgi:hypothetical protein
MPRLETFGCIYALKSCRIQFLILIVDLDNILLPRVHQLQRLLHAYAEFSYFVLYLDFILFGQENREIEFGKSWQWRYGI